MNQRRGTFIIKRGGIRLVGLKLSDADSIYRHIRDREIFKYTDVKQSFSRADTIKLIESSRNDIKKGIGYRLGIKMADNPEIIGMINLTEIDRKNKKAELDYWLNHRYRKMGVMKEAIELMISFGFKKLGLERIYARTLVENIPSWKLLTATGFTREGVLRKGLFENNHWHDLFVYSILKEEFKHDKEL